MKNLEETREFARKTPILIIGEISNFAISFLLNFIIIRLLTIEQYCTYSRVLAIPTILLYIADLALLLSNLLHRKIQLSGIAPSKDTCFEALEDMKEIRLYYDDKCPPEVLLTQMSTLQRKLFKTLDLKRFTEK